MKHDKSRLRQRLRRVEGARSEHLEVILSEREPLRRGSFVTLRRKCGKPNCRCATGQGHPATCLSVKEEGHTRMVYVPGHLAEKVAEQATRYRRFRKARARLAKLARQSLGLIDALERALGATDDIGDRKKAARGPRTPPGRDG